MAGADLMGTPPLFQRPAPGRELVLDQGFPFSKRHWLDRLPDKRLWPVILDDCPQVGSWPRVNRRIVFTVAEPATTPDAAIRLYVAAAVWGVGLRARNVTRRIWALADGQEVGKKLAGAVDLLLTEGPVAAYAALADGACRVKHLGPSFFTKFLYFAGWDRTSGDRQPLILDRYVTFALNELAGLGWTPYGGWTADHYDRYLDYANGWAERWCGGVPPDVVEQTLFEHGRQIARKRESGALH